MRIRRWIPLCMAIVMFGGAWTLYGQSSQDAQLEAKKKLLAQRAARADAIRKLAEQIKGLQIKSDTYVRDFVAESDTIDTALNASLLGMKEEGDYKHYDDGTCEVTMSVTVQRVITELKRIHKAYYKGDKVKINDLENIKQTTKYDKITATGAGAAPEELLPEPIIPADGGSSRSPGKVPPYWQKHCSGRGRLMAMQAARADAFRRLAERIKGVRIASDTTVQDFVAESDEIDVEMSTFIKGAHVTGYRFHRNELICEAEAEVKLRTVVATLKSWGDAHYKGDKVKLKQMQDYVERVRYDTIKETGMGVPPPKYLKGYTPAQVTALQQVAGPNVPSWATDTLRATGQAAVDNTNDNPAQAKLMAYRAAELDARRKLAEQLNGLKISSDTSVRDFVAQADEIRTKMVAYQLGASVVDSSRKINDDGTAEVTVEIDLKPLWNIVVAYVDVYPLR